MNGDLFEIWWLILNSLWYIVTCMEIVGMTFLRGCAFFISWLMSCVGHFVRCTWNEDVPCVQYLVCNGCVFELLLLSDPAVPDLRVFCFFFFFSVCLSHICNCHLTKYLHRMGRGPDFSICWKIWDLFFQMIIGCYIVWYIFIYFFYVGGRVWYLVNFYLVYNCFIVDGS